jgi:hypothetical protein
MDDPAKRDTGMALIQFGLGDDHVAESRARMIASARPCDIP